MTSRRTPNLVLRGWRETRGMTRPQMADALNKTPAAQDAQLCCNLKLIAMWESGKIRWPSLRYRRALHQLTGHDPAALGFAAPLHGAATSHPPARPPRPPPARSPCISARRTLSARPVARLPGVGSWLATAGRCWPHPMSFPPVAVASQVGPAHFPPTRSERNRPGLIHLAAGWHLFRCPAVVLQADIMSAMAADRSVETTYLVVRATAGRRERGSWRSSWATSRWLGRGR